jgi:hypothetical protein
VRVGQVLHTLLVTGGALVVAVADVGVLDGVRERERADVVQQRRDAQAFVQHGRGMPRARIEEFVVRHCQPQRAHHRVHRVHHTDRVGEAVVLGAWEDVVREAELLDPTQALEERRVDDALLPLRDRDETVEHVVDDAPIAHRAARRRERGFGGAGGGTGGLARGGLRHAPLILGARPARRKRADLRSSASCRRLSLRPPAARRWKPSSSTSGSPFAPRGWDSPIAASSMASWSGSPMPRFTARRERGVHAPSRRNSRAASISSAAVACRLPA